MTTQDAEMQKVIARCRKILALAGNNPNEHEAQRASEKVQEILAEYNLGMGDVADKGAEPEKFVIDNSLSNDSFPWKRQIGASVAELYFCTYFYTMVGRGRTRKDYHSFVGAPHNVEVVKMMFTYLVSAIESLAREGALSQSLKEREAYRRAFMWACCHRVAVRIADRVAATKAKPTKQEGSGNTLPALADLYDSTKAKLTTFIEGEVGKLGEGSKKGGRTSSRRGREDGDAAGRKIGLDTQVGGSGKAAGLIQ